MSRRRTLRAAAIALGLAAGLVVGEIGTRWIGALRSRDAGPPPVERFTYTPGPQIEVFAAGGAVAGRLVVVGDSYTWGHGVAPGEAYPALLGERLRAAGTPAEVVSFARPGWNTRFESHALAASIGELDPDLLVVGYCLNDAERFETRRMLAARPELLPRWPEGAAGRLLGHSRLIESTWMAVEALRLRPALARYYAGLYADEEGAALWRRSLQRLRRLAEGRGAPAVLVVFPIFDSPLERDYAYEPLHRLVAATAREQGWRVLDLLPVYRQHDGRSLALVPYTDPHPSRLAHRLAAEEIAAFLGREDLWPPTRSGS